MNRTFDIAAGSIPGRDHVGAGRLLVGRNNQDACAWRCTGDWTLAVVCDGCSSGIHSEVGAALGARLVLAGLERRVAGAGADGFASRLADLRHEVLRQLADLSQALGGELATTVSDYLLFTVLGAAVGPEATLLFALGDGVFYVNGDLLRIGPYPGNAPPYLGYALLADGSDLDFALVRSLPTAEVTSLLVGTDGVLDLAAAADRTVPGTTEPVGPIAGFWERDVYFANPDAIRRRLARMNSSAVRLDGRTGETVQEPGLLRDDTSLIVIRRRTGAARE